jgi:hypothetical protein
LFPAHLEYLDEESEERGVGRSELVRELLDREIIGRDASVTLDFEIEEDDEGED